MPHVLSSHTNHNSKHHSNKKQGFTLVELLVAIAIFAVLAALGWKVFDYLMKVKERNQMHEQSLSILQDAYLQIQRDSLQTVPFTAQVGTEVQPALMLNNNTLSFSKIGVTDPLKQGLSPFERIEYQYNTQDKKLYRLKYNGLNLNASAQPLSSVLLNDVEDVQITVLNPNSLNQWPENMDSSENLQSLQHLPRGISIHFRYKDTEYDWLLSLLDTSFLNQKQDLSQNNASSP